MLIPREQPYLDGLNSYYLHIDKFVEHMQGEIGSGCLYFRSSTEELLVYFDEQEVLRGVVQNNNQRARVLPTLAPVLSELQLKSFKVTVYTLAASAIFFWEQIPQFQRAKTTLHSTDITLPDLIFRLKQKRFSGFVDVTIKEKNESGLLFFHQGSRVGGSYSWGEGGLDPSDAVYNDLLSRLQKDKGLFAIGHFLAKKAGEELQEQKAASEENDNPVYQANLIKALQEFLDFFILVMRRKTKSDPVILLKQHLIDKVEEYPFIDPFTPMFDYKDGVVTFFEDVPREKLAAAIVDNAWEIIFEHRVEKKFRAGIKKWEYKSALEERGIEVVR